jgi:hypothetical protein
VLSPQIALLNQATAPIGRIGGAIGEAAGWLSAFGGPVTAVVGKFIELGIKGIGILWNLFEGFAKAAFGLEHWNDSLLETQRHFAEFSGSMAQVISQWDVFKALQAQQVGEKLAPSAGDLEQSMEKLSSAIQPYTTGIQEILNIILTVIVDVITAFIEGFEAILQVLSHIPLLGKAAQVLLDWLNRNRVSKDAIMPAGEWLSNTIRQWDRRKAAGVLGARQPPGGFIPVVP